jgi:magnesium-transporting ATPase (P-type)
MGGLFWQNVEGDLLQALRKDNQKKLKEIIVNNSLNPDALYTKRKRTLVQLSCYFLSPKCLKTLIELNYDYNKKEIINNYSPLYIACKFNSLPIVKILLSKDDCKILQKTTDNNNEFEIAFLKGNYDICYYLLYEYLKVEEIKNEDNDENNINNEKDIGDSEFNYSVHTYFTRRKNNYTEENENKKNESIIIEQQNFLLRGCSLRQTESVLCFVVYTGKNTKIMQNSPSSRAKTSSLEKRMNSQIKYIFLFQILLSLTASFFSLFQIIKSGGNPTPYLYKEHEIDNYVNFEEYSKKVYNIFSNKNLKKVFSNSKDSIFIIIKKLYKHISPIFDLKILLFFILKLGTWCVLMNNLVPISLLMTMEIVKYFQGWFISWDVDIYDRDKKIMTKVQTSTLNEELGQVKYIFSDKTGTLTKNYMNFKRVTIGYSQYNKQEIKEKENNIENYNNIYSGENKNSTDIVINVNSNKKNKNRTKEKKFDFDNTNVEFIDEKNKNININDKNNISNKNIRILNYRDDYGIITNVLFLNDEKFREDLNSIFNKGKNDIEKLDNEEDNIDNKENSLSNSSKEDEDENISLNNNLEYNINEEKEEKLTQEKYLDLFMTAISTCHSGIISEKEYEKDKKLVYQASSPDEVAILNFARKYKYIFYGRKDNNKIILEKPKMSKNILTT